MGDNPGPESVRLFKDREREGFWKRFVPGPQILDIGFRGHTPGATPLFRSATGLETDTPGYNGRDIPFPGGHFDCVHASHVLEHIDDYRHFLMECFRVLRVGGTLILMVPHQEFYEKKAAPPSRFNGDHKRFYTIASLVEEIRSSLPREAHHVSYLREVVNHEDLKLPPETHSVGPYEIVIVVEKVC